MTRITSIYVLRDPRTNDVRYVGKTGQPIKVRLAAHIRRAAEARTYRDCWILSLIALGLSPVVELIDSTDGDWQALEISWIAFYREALGSKLTNQTVGGEGLDPESASRGWTSDRKAKQGLLTAEMNRSRAGVKWSSERREEQSLIQKKRWNDDGRRAQQSETMKQVAADPLYRKNMATSVSRAWTSERRARQSEIAKQVNESRWGRK